MQSWNNIRLVNRSFGWVRFRSSLFRRNHFEDKYYRLYRICDIAKLIVIPFELLFVLLVGTFMLQRKNCFLCSEGKMCSVWKLYASVGFRVNWIWHIILPRYCRESIMPPWCVKNWIWDEKSNTAPSIFHWRPDRFFQFPNCILLFQPLQSQLFFIYIQIGGEMKKPETGQQLSNV